MNVAWRRTALIFVSATLSAILPACGAGDAIEAPRASEVQDFDEGLDHAAITPEGWTCEARWWGEGWCDCGCGVPDVNDCDDETIYACIYNACQEEARPDPNNPTACQPLFEACHPGHIYATQLPRRHRPPPEKKPIEPKR